MNELQMSDLTGFDWAVLWDSLRALGIDFAIRLLIAIVIFMLAAALPAS
jgi:hypothetical protein